MRSSDLRNRPPLELYRFQISRNTFDQKQPKFIAREPWLGAGSCTGGTLGPIIILRVLTPGPHACSKSRVPVELYPRLPVTVVFLKFFYPPSRSKAPDICTPSSRALGAAPAPTASRGACDASCDAEGNRECNPGFCRRLRLRSCISEISF